MEAIRQEIEGLKSIMLEILDVVEKQANITDKQIKQFGKYNEALDKIENVLSMIVSRFENENKI